MKRVIYIVLAVFLLAGCKNQIVDNDVVENTQEVSAPKVKVPLGFSAYTSSRANCEYQYNKNLIFLLDFYDLDGILVQRESKPYYLNETEYEAMCKAEAQYVREEKGQTEEQCPDSMFNFPSYKEYSENFSEGETLFYDSLQKMMIMIEPGTYDVKLNGYALSDNECTSPILQGETRVEVKEEGNSCCRIPVTIIQGNRFNGGIEVIKSFDSATDDVKNVKVLYIAESEMESDTQEWKGVFVKSRDEIDQYEDGGEITVSHYKIFSAKIPQLTPGNYLVSMEWERTIDRGNPIICRSKNIVTVTNGFYTECNMDSNSSGQKGPIWIPITFNLGHGSAANPDWSNPCPKGYYKLGTEITLTPPNNPDNYTFSGWGILDSNEDAIDIALACSFGDNNKVTIYSIPTGGTINVVAYWE